MRNLIKMLQSFGTAAGGSVSILFGVMFICLMLVAGIAIDSARFYDLSSRIQASLDTASLAGAKLLIDDSLSDSDITALTQTYFDASIANTGVNIAQITPLEVNIDRANATVEARSVVKVTSLFGSLANLPSLNRIERASKVAHSVKRIELSMVLDITGSMAPAGKIDALKLAAKDMIEAMYSSDPAKGVVKAALVPYAAAVNAGPYIGSVTPVPNVQDTCAIERDVTEVFTGAAAVGVDQVDTFYDDDETANGHYSCPTSKVIPLTDLSKTGDRDAFKTEIDNLTPGGWTAGHIGAAWGWYTVSPEWSGIWPAASAPKPYSPDVIKAVVIMTDGEFNTNYRNGAQNAGCGSPGAWNTDSGCHQALQICQNMKAAGVKVFTVSFLTPPDAEAMLQECAGPGNFYNADNSAQLSGAFRDIVQKLTSLRITS